MGAHVNNEQGLAIHMTDLVQTFGDRSVLRQLDLTIPAGQFVAIVGRSGCGKSTLLRLLAGLNASVGGTIYADGKPLSQQQGDVRLMFQDARLLPWKSVIDNVGLGLSGNWRVAAREALASVGLLDRENEWPAVLSGGQRQRVALARALVHRPRLLLLDEPLGALDALTRIEMQCLLERLWLQHRFTVLLVTHDVSEAVSVADRVLLIEEGKIGFDVAIDVARPRSHGEPVLADIQQQVLNRVLSAPS